MSEVGACWVDEHCFEVHLDGKTSRVSVTSDAHLHHTGDALLGFCLPIAMATGSRLVIEDDVDERLMRSQARVQEVLSFRIENLTPVEVNAPSMKRPPRPNVAGFFSGGVDSTYTALQHQAELTQLVFVHGFDTSADQGALRAQISERLGVAANTLGIPLVEISTNLRDVSDPVVGWNDYHSAALAGIAHMLDAGVCLLPANHNYKQGVEITIRPLSDPLWSSAAVQIEHDGANLSRVEKIAAIARDQRALDWLRVCYKNPDQTYNCGTCEKCVRTMLSLHALGALDHSPTFPNHLRPSTVRRLRLHNRSALAFAKENLTILDGPFRRALRAAYVANAGRRMMAVTVERLESRGPSWVKPLLRFVRLRARALRSSRIHT
jgi:7-cyano-7-deazaguanine synthase in queuosine biosynthesis